MVCKQLDLLSEIRQQARVAEQEDARGTELLPICLQLPLVEGWVQREQAATHSCRNLVRIRDLQQFFNLRFFETVLSFSKAESQHFLLSVYKPIQFLRFNKTKPFRQSVLALASDLAQVDPVFCHLDCCLRWFGKLSH